MNDQFVLVDPPMKNNQRVEKYQTFNFDEF